MSIALSVCYGWLRPGRLTACLLHQGNMNEKLARYMRGFEHKYPHNLEARYERVLNKIVELWGDDYRKIAKQAGYRF